MAERYSVYYAGQVMEGREPGEVREKLGKVFKADEQTLDRLFSGKPQLLKRDCDKETAQKYLRAMENAGAVPLLKALDAEKPASAADRIAALAAAAPDEQGYQSDTPDEPTAAEPAQSPGAADADLDLAPEGTAVLREEERSQVPERDIDTGDLAVDTGAERLSEEPPPPPTAPDTSHLQMGEVGEDIPNLPGQAVPVNPDLSGLELSAEGTDFSDCAAQDAPSPTLDLSGLDLAPEGSEVLEERYRGAAKGEAPSTDHLSLEE